MADYSDSRNFGTKTYPVNALETSDLLRRVEPMLTPELMVSRYLKGIDLGLYSDEDLKDKINLAMNVVELETNMVLTKTQFKERMPYDSALYQHFVYTKVKHGPVLSVESLSIESSNGEKIFELPPRWLEMGYAYRRQINVVPLLSTFGAAGLATAQATSPGLVFLQAIAGYNWVPAWWSITYTSGPCSEEGKMPVLLNQLVGMTAAIDILSQLQAIIFANSQSISQDGISQSSSGAGNQQFANRINELLAKKKEIQDKFMAVNSNKYFLSNI